MISRRDVVKAGLAGSAALATGALQSSRTEAQALTSLQIFVPARAAAKRSSIAAVCQTAVTKRSGACSGAQNLLRSRHGRLASVRGRAGDRRRSRAR
ncbi:MAG: twin-arginine translocation signal domain-containing protein [Sphingomonadales bacterium]|nr:twin-arginine translocation signal domain-containing protein [Sphingomonadales bacterium]